MKYSYNWLQSLIEELPEVERLAELLTEYSFEVEEIIEQGDDYVLDIDVLPNRASDCLSHRGIAREIEAILSYHEEKVAFKRIRPGLLFYRRI